MDVAEQKNDSETASRCEELCDRNGDSSTNKATTSDDIVKDLLNEVRSLEKPFSVEDLASKKRDKEKKKSKEHKHKKSKKKKKKHRSKRDRSGSRKLSRSRSRSSKKKHRKRSRSRSKSRSKSSSRSRTPSRFPTPLRSDVEDEKDVVVKKESDVKPTPYKSPPFPEKSLVNENSDDDDLPVGADFRTVMNEAKKKINMPNKIGSSLDLAALPVAPPLAKPRSSHAFPLSKPVKKDADEEVPLAEKRESDVLNKVIAEKGRGDFIPRNLKVKTAASDNSTTQAQQKTEGADKEVESKPFYNLKDESLMDVSADEDEKDAEFGPSPLPPPAPTTSSTGLVGFPPAPAPEPISDGELEMEIAEINAAAQPKTVVKSSRLEKVVESSSAVISKSAPKDGNVRKRRRSPRKRSSSPNTDEELRIRARTARANKIMRRASPYRPRGRRRDDRERRSRSRSRRLYSRSKTKSRSRERYRRRSRSKSRSRSRSRSSDRYKSRRSRSRSSSRSRSCSRSSSQSRSRSRSRSRSSERTPRSPRRRLGGEGRRRHGGGGSRHKRGRIDKAKLLAIARKKAQKMQLVRLRMFRGEGCVVRLNTQDIVAEGAIDDESQKWKGVTNLFKKSSKQECDYFQD
ncbi:hypothetical protein Y032_0270g867 [Ancylostoma ceylanicum]|uniref:Uncharacterized protein n=1 Tax=Ancylostoma ceylanicum TaxID=53326 RepID=A0A016S8M2_9BILA|nr:hypothetical protein Y032_0270g867 [Ancylostoma ceylanicum]